MAVAITIYTNLSAYSLTVCVHTYMFSLSSLRSPLQASGIQPGSAKSEPMAVLLQEIATAEGKKAALEMSARAVREEHEDLQRELETVQLSVEAAKADVTTAQRELRTLRDKVRTPAGCVHTAQVTKADFVTPLGCKMMPTAGQDRTGMTEHLYQYIILQVDM